jgi:hypothetical protein
MIEDDETGAGVRTSVDKEQPSQTGEVVQSSSDVVSGRPTSSKLSLNVNTEISERLRQLAYANRLSESSIAEVALAMFFARGDDAMLGILLRELGATLRRK